MGFRQARASQLGGLNRASVLFPNSNRSEHVHVLATQVPTEVQCDRCNCRIFGGGSLFRGPPAQYAPATRMGLQVFLETVDVLYCIVLYCIVLYCKSMYSCIYLLLERDQVPFYKVCIYKYTYSCFERYN